MRTNLLKRKEGRPLSSIFLRLFSLLVMLVVGMSAWSQTTISTKTLFSSTAPAPAYGDAYDLGTNGKVHYYAQGLKDGSGDFVHRNYGGKEFYKLQNNEVSQAHINCSLLRVKLKLEILSR